MPRNGINKGRKPGSKNKKGAMDNTIAFRVNDVDYAWIKKQPDTRKYLTELIRKDRGGA